MHKNPNERLLIPAAIASASIILALFPPQLSPLGNRSVSASGDWEAWGTTAWNYYRPGVGINSGTGLPYATTVWHWFTDWDLSSYMTGILDAEILGLITEEGPWGSTERIDKILDFIETRQLMSDGTAYWAYNADDLGHTDRPTDSSDAGRLLVALARLRQAKPQLTSRINDIVHITTNFQLLAADNSRWNAGGFYAYYIAQGFRAFGWGNQPLANHALSTLDNLATGEHVDVYGVDLPKTWITSEPIFQYAIDFPYEEDLWEYASGVYEAQKRRYEETGEFTAFSEGAYDRSPHYIYEWIVQPPDNTWTITDPSIDPLNISPVAFLKAAAAMHALYNEPYTTDLMNWLTERTATNNGFREGVDESGRTISTLTDKTNVWIIASARYALHGSLHPPQNCSEELCTINILNYDYTPRTITIRPNVTLLWTNRDNANHALVSGTPDNPSVLFNPGIIKPGETFQYTLTTPGTYYYHDEAHTYMIGQIIVEGEPIVEEEPVSEEEEPSPREEPIPEEEPVAEKEEPTREGEPASEEPNPEQKPPPESPSLPLILLALIYVALLYTLVIRGRITTSSAPHAA